MRARRTFELPRFCVAFHPLESGTRGHLAQPSPWKRSSPSATEPSRALRDRAEPSRAELSRAKPSRAEQALSHAAPSSPCVHLTDEPQRPRPCRTKPRHGTSEASKSCSTSSAALRLRLDALGAHGSEKPTCSRRVAVSDNLLACASMSRCWSKCGFLVCRLCRAKRPDATLALRRVEVHWSGRTRVGTSTTVLSPHWAMTAQKEARLAAAGGQRDSAATTECFGRRQALLLIRPQRRRWTRRATAPPGPCQGVFEFYSGLRGQLEQRGVLMRGHAMEAPSFVEHTRFSIALRHRRPRARYCGRMRFGLGSCAFKEACDVPSGFAHTSIEG
jgi:hypothetical protein